MTNFKSSIIFWSRWRFRIKNQKQYSNLNRASILGKKHQTLLEMLRDKISQEIYMSVTQGQDPDSNC